MEDFEVRALCSPPIRPLIYKRYVDDTFTILNKNKTSAFLNHLNSINSKIQCTIELEANNSLAFLDILVVRNPDNTLGHTVYRKPTHTDRYLNGYSHHHPIQLATVGKSLLQRAQHLCDADHLEAELQHVKHALTINNLPVPRQHRKKHLKPPTVERQPAILPYVKGVTDRIGNILKKVSIKTIYKPHKKVSQFLRPIKSNIPLQQAGVYKLDCDCVLSYIGQTKRSIGTRVKEHISDIKNRRASKSAVCEHTMDKPGHYIRFDKPQILAREDKYIPRLIREAIEIKKHPNFNREDGWNLSNTWDPVLKNIKSHVRNHTAGPQDTVSAFCRHPERYARKLRNRWRLSRAIEPLLRREQAGFRPNRSCTDQIITLRIILEQASEWQREMYLTFVDFEKAFDTLRWTGIWERLREVGVPDKIINLIKALYRKYSCKVIHNGLLSEDIPVNAGVRQGCLLSPILFLVVLDGIMQKVTKSKRRGIEWGLSSTLEDLDYADDLCLLSHTHANMQTKLDDLRREALEMGLKINTRKTQEMRCGATTSLPLLIGTEAIEKIHKYTYLGSIVSESGGAEEDIASRIAKSRAAFAQLRPVWQSRKLTRRVKLKIFRSNVKSVLLYGCETWKVTKDISHRLQVFVNWCLRRILGIYWPEKISNVNLWERCGETPIDLQIKRRKWKWIGHALRRDPEHIPKQALDWTPEGKRKRRDGGVLWLHLGDIGPSREEEN
nr:uncharacterized protein LOC116767039 [Danaus plexippus plexippus]